MNTDTIAHILAFTEEYAGKILPVALTLLAAEFIFPKSKYTVMSHIRGAVFCATNIVITKVSLTLFYRLWEEIGVSPLLRIDLRFLSEFSDFWMLQALGGVVASLIVLQVSEFFYYWFHRLQHSNRFFWRLC